MKKSLLLLGLGILGLALGAQTSDDDLFSGDGVTVQTENPAQDPEKALLTNETSQTVRWAGGFSSDFGWGGSWAPVDNPTQGWQDQVTVSLKANFALIARPEPEVTYKIRLDTSYPFAVGVTYTDPVDSLKKKVTVPDLKIWELYADFPLIKDLLEARIGKQPLSWGASRFYSPGDLMAYTAKDAADVNAEREGPMALELRWLFTNLPKGIQTAGVKGYLLAKEDYFPSNQTPTYRELGYALQGEIAFGNTEFTLGGFYQQSLAPKGVFTWKQGIGQINFFSEAVVSWGADKKFVEDDALAIPFGFKSVKKSSEWFFSGTAGLSYMKDDWSKLSVYAEYFYNGLGSSDKKYIEKAYTLYGLGQMSAGDILNPGIHNAAASLGFGELFGTDKLNFYTLWQGNLSDQSGWVYPYLTFKANDWFKITAGARYAYGDRNTQFPIAVGLMSGAIPSPGSPMTMDSRLGFLLSATLGTGKF